MSIFLISAFILCFRVWNHVLPEWLELVEQSCALFGRGKHNNEKSSDFWSVVLFKEARWGRSQSQEWSEPIVLAIWASVWQIQGQDLQMALGYMAYNVNSMWSKTATSSPLSVNQHSFAEYFKFFPEGREALALKKAKAKEQMASSKKIYGFTVAVLRISIF